MKRAARFLLALAIVFTTLSATAVFAADYKETPIDQAGDWFATLGKQGAEKDSILAQRKADRLAKFAQREAQKAAKEAEKAGNDMKKKMGF